MRDSSSPYPPRIVSSGYLDGFADALCLVWQCQEEPPGGVRHGPIIELQPRMKRGENGNENAAPNLTSPCHQRRRRPGSVHDVSPRNCAT
eukprot:671430-Rhodomonas_salina.2